MVSKSSAFHSKIIDGASRQNFLAIFDNLYLSANDSEISINGVRITDNFNTGADLRFGETPSNTFSAEILNLDGSLNHFKWGQCKTYIGVLLNDSGYTRAAGDNAMIVLGSDTWTCGSYGVKVNGAAFYSGKEVFSLVSDNRYIYAVGDGFCIRIRPRNRDYSPYQINRFMYHKLKTPHGLVWDEDNELCTVWTQYGTIENWEYCPMGVFNVDQPAQHKQARLNLTESYDNMILFDYDAEDFLTSLKFPLTLGDIVTKICRYVGVTLSTPEFTNSDYEYAESPFDPDDSITLRDVLGYIAERANCIAHMDRRGGLELRWIKSGPSKVIPLGRIGYEDYYQADYFVGKPTRISVKADNGKVYSKGHGRNEYVITGNPLIQRLYSSQRKAINRLPVYVPTSFTALEGDPSIEAGDNIKYTLSAEAEYAFHSNYDALYVDGGNRVFKVQNEIIKIPVMVQTLVWRGYTRVTYMSEGNITREKESGAQVANRAAKTAKSKANSQNAEMSAAISAVGIQSQRSVDDLDKKIEKANKEQAVSLKKYTDDKITEMGATIPDMLSGYLTTGKKIKNANDAVTAGLYKLASGISGSNSPYSSAAATILTLGYSEDNCTQLAVPQGTTTVRVDMRKLVNGTWGAWSKII